MRSTIVSVLFCSIISMLYPQYNIDAGGFVGLANYLGEIGGDEKASRKFLLDMKLMQTRWALGIFGRFRISPLFSVNTGFSYARIQGADSLSANPGRKGRNLSFRNDFFECSLKGELYLFQTNKTGIYKKRKYKTDLKLYGFAGAAIIYHNPKTKYNGTWVALQPMQTEGVEYSKIQAVVPVGAGFYFTKNKNHRIGIETGWRITFTDYLDDVSTVYADPAILSSPMSVALANRNGELNIKYPNIVSSSDAYLPGNIRGNSKNNDTYIFLGITYSYAFKSQPKFVRKKFSCS